MTVESLNFREIASAIPERWSFADEHAATNGIVMLDLKGRLTHFNPACERMFGYRAADVLGGDLTRLILAPEHGELPRAASRHRRPGARRSAKKPLEVTGRRKNGETFPLDLAIGAANRDGEVFYVGLLRDMTNRQRADDERERLVERLAASNEERAHFLHIASHDLKEPLRLVAGFCGLLLKDYGDRLDDRGREYASATVSAAARMTYLLDDLVEVARLDLDAGRECWFEAAASLDHVLGVLQPAIQKSGARITRGPLPRIFGNSTRFPSLLQNLIGNALKYVAEGAAPAIHVSAKREGGFWRFRVADNGIGIAERHHDRIFEPFKRLHAAGRYEGAGLGLAICRKIVDDFGGRIWVSSTQGQGSTFNFTIKNHEREHDHDGAGDRDSEQAGGTSPD